MEDQTIPVREGEEFDRENVARFLKEHIDGLADAPMEVRQFPTGASNLTYLIRIGEWQAVMRRPPLGPLPPKAHDMEREAMLLEKLHPVFPLAPKPYAICRDTSLLGAVFYVMEYRRGVVIDDAFPPGVKPTPDACRRISEAVVDTLVKLHSIDWVNAGLASMGRPEGFLERQVTGWITRYYKAKTDEIPGVDSLVRWLSEHVPESPESTVIHNDFKLNNMLWHPDDVATPVAVLDWEMTTIGDPLFDLAVALSYWVQADDPEELTHVLPSVTTYPGFMSRDEFLERYAQKSGRDLSSMHFYMTFAYFKLAVILQQIYARWKSGQTKDSRFSSFGERVHYLMRHACALVQGRKP
jgi:aminoglycoside phosphotransferase (APT) family kinase protein